MKEKIRIGVVGLGSRALCSWEAEDTIAMNYDGLVRVLGMMDDVEFVGVCDTYQDRVDDAISYIKEFCGQDVYGTTDYNDLLKDESIDAIFIFCSWELHVRVAVAAIKANKAVALEVGGAYSVEDCWRLVRAQEETGAFFMMLENCCYGRLELAALAMVREGLFGEIVHCSGGYHHDIRYEISFGEEMRHYRLRNYLSRNCENYPTHELGPIAKILNINDGNRMVSLSSFASKAAGLNEYNRRLFGDNYPLAKARFAQGDIVTTMIKCAGGETILLTLDTTLPRAPITRNIIVRGTKGLLSEPNSTVFIEEEALAKDIYPTHENNLEDYIKKYRSPMWKEYDEGTIKAGHGGMDWQVLRAFIESWKNDIPAPIDVYDAAAWMSISALSEESIIKGGAVVEIPDFTNGRWIKRAKKPQFKYSL